MVLQFVSVAKLQPLVNTLNTNVGVLWRYFVNASNAYDQLTSSEGDCSW